MLSNYGLVALFIVITFAFAVVTILIPVALRFLKVIPYKPTAVKSATYECGLPTIGKSWVQFNFRYYTYALLFVALDVLVVLLYPWAVGLRAVGLYGFVGVIVLVLILLVGYIYAWKKKVLEWM